MVAEPGAAFCRGVAHDGLGWWQTPVEVNLLVRLQAIDQGDWQWDGGRA